MSEQFYKDEMNREMLLNVQIQKQLYAVLPKMNISKQFVSPTTQEMVDNYNQQFKTKGKTFIFPNTEQPELDKIYLEVEYSIDEVKDIRDELDSFVKEYNETEYKTLPNLQKDYIEIKKQYDRNTDTTQFDRLRDELADINKKIRENKIRQRQIITDFKTSENKLLENDKIIERNTAKIITKQKNDRQKLKGYSDTIRALNNGIVNPIQGQNESEDEFLNRLQLMSEIEEDPTNAILFNIGEFKKNMKTIINKEWLIESILKSITYHDVFLINLSFAGFKKKFIEDFGINNNQFVLDDYLFFIQDYFDKKKEPEKKESMSIETQTDEPDKRESMSVETQTDEPPIEQPIEPIEYSPEKKKPIDPFNNNRPRKPKTPIKQPIEQPIEPNRESIEMPIFKNITVSVKDNGVLFENLESQTYLILRPYNKPTPDKRLSSNTVQFSLNGVAYTDITRSNATKKSFPAELSKILNSANFPPTDKKLLTNAIKSNATKSISDYNKLYKLLDGYVNQSSSVGSGLKRRKNKLKIDKGKTLKEVDKYCHFGRLVLLLNKLYYQNILSVKDKNNVNVQGIPNRKVSDAFVNILMKICSDNDVSSSDIEKLDEDELILYSVLIAKAKLSKDFTIDIKKSISVLKKKLELIEGEIQAGNNNLELKKQLYDVVFKLSNIGVISISSARKYYNDTIKLYFNK